MMDDGIIYIRVDASQTIGCGHVYRCLTLAERLRNASKCSIEFIMKKLPGDMQNFITGKGFSVHSMPEKDYYNSKSDFEFTRSIIEKSSVTRKILIIDHYDLGYDWEEWFYRNCDIVLVIDDLIDKKHCCHFLLNQTPFVKENSYTSLVSNNAQLLLGEKYILLRPEFERIRPKVNIEKNYSEPRFHIFFGSNDTKNYSYKYSKIMLDHFDTISLKVIQPNLNANTWAALKRKYKSRITIIDKPISMPETMSDCDLALGAPGMTTWERATLGLAGIYIATNKNQTQILRKLDDIGFCHYIGLADEIDDNFFIEKVKTILNEKQILKKMSSFGFNQIDAQGVERVTNIVLNIK
ncbi:MAG: UDP-2,4-diacetamido-2,4,6-trideoxy-beta-L-altropyranose hydrolase [Gammaproteobacteria bacterium]